VKRLLLALVLASAFAVPAALGARTGNPSVRFVTPTNGADTGSSVTFKVALTNFTIDPADVGKHNKFHKGHLHFQMDGGKFDYPKFSGPNGDLAKTLGIAGTYSPSIAPVIVYEHLPAGKHTLTVFLANNDHSAEGAGDDPLHGQVRPRARLGGAAAAVILATFLGAAGSQASRVSAGAARPVITIRFGEFFFRPSAVTVHVGQKVRFVDVGKIAHTVADTDARWNIRSKLIHPRLLGPGQSQTVVFARPGLVRYLCTLHPSLMRGTIHVVG
jgi:plastocyanin